AEHGDRPGIAEPPELVRTSEPGCAAANDDDLAYVGVNFGRSSVGLELVAYVGLLAVHIDLPAIQRVESRRTQCGARLQIEAGMMERAANRPTSRNAVGK